MRVLILGGTSEARDLAALLDADPAFDVISSLAGRVSKPALPAGPSVLGGFGGVPGLRAFLADEAVDLVIDATHPFARTMSVHAVEACGAEARPLLPLRRPGWRAQPGDRWIRVASVEAAAALTRTLAGPNARIFVTTGRQQLRPYAADPDRHYLIRTVDPPDPADLPLRHTLLLDRGPYQLDGERALLRAHDVRVLVTKDSGGAYTYPKIVAAREAGIPVVVVDRPVLPDTGLAPVRSGTEAYERLRTLVAERPA